MLWEVVEVEVDDTVTCLDCCVDCLDGVTDCFDRESRGGIPTSF